MWRDEIGRRFTNAVGVLVHGGDFVEGQWIVGTHRQPWEHVTPIQTLVRDVQAKYPDRTIVLLACNTGHLPLGIPGVYYASSSVWCVPDRAITPDMFENGLAMQKLDKPWCQIIVEPVKTRWQEDPDAVGNIFEFVTD